MTRESITALQAILIRERLILYQQHRRLTDKPFSVRQLIEAVVFSEANESAPRTYDEDMDIGTRYDAGLPLKNNTIENLISRKTSAIANDNLGLLRDFLAFEGFLSPTVLALCGLHPDSRLRTHFAGIAPTDARLQKFRGAVEGEYFRSEDRVLHQFWIAAPGRSQPFVTVRATTPMAAQMRRAALPTLKTINLDTATPPQTRHEGRVFLMPGESTTLIEMSMANRTWDGLIHRVGVGNDAIVLHNALREPVILERVTPQRCATAQRASYSLKEAASASEPRRWPSRETRLQDFGKYQRVLESAARRSAAPSRKKAALNQKLIDAAKAGDASGVFETLIAGADINYQDAVYGRTATHWAAANGALDVVFILAAPANDGPRVLSTFASALALDTAKLGFWQKSRKKRDPLLLDNEQCFASACAPAATDNSERNRQATEIWKYLFQIELRQARIRYGVSVFAFLEVWKPSSVMQEAARLYGAPLPAGFADPKPE